MTRELELVMGAKREQYHRDKLDIHSFLYTFHILFANNLFFRSTTTKVDQLQNALEERKATFNSLAAK